MEGVGGYGADSAAASAAAGSASAADGRLPSDLLAFLQAANVAFADQIRSADQKATYILTFQIAILVWSLEVKSVFEAERLQAESALNLAVSVALGVAILVTLFSAGLVILPREGRTGTSLYWNAWPAAGQPLRAAIEGGDRTFLLREYLQNLEALSEIARRKYRFVRIAFASLGAMTLLYFVAIAVK